MWCDWETLPLPKDTNFAEMFTYISVSINHAAPNGPEHAHAYLCQCSDSSREESCTCCDIWVRWVPELTLRRRRECRVVGAPPRWEGGVRGAASAMQHLVTTGRSCKRQKLERTVRLVVEGARNAQSGRTRCGARKAGASRARHRH